MSMNYIKVFAVKFLIIGTLTFSIFGIFFHATISRMLFMTLIVAGVTFLGDLFILPRMNQALAVIGDAVLFFVLYWLLGSIVIETGVSVILPAITAAYFGVMAEAIYHIYVMERLHEADPLVPSTIQYQTEFSEEPAAMEENNEKE